MTIQSTQHREVAASATRTVTVDFTDELDGVELLTGTPTVAELTSTDLTIASVAITTAAHTIFPDGPDNPSRVVAIGKGVQFSVSGQLAATAYRVSVSVDTDATPAQTIVGIFTFNGEQDTA